MHFSIAKNILMKALAHGQSVVDKRTAMPVLGHVLLDAQHNGEDPFLSILATNLDMALSEQVAAQVHEPGQICVPAHLLYDIIRKLRDQPVEFKLDPHTLQLELTSGRSRFSLPGISVDEFPQITKTPLTHTFDLPRAHLRFLLEQSRFAVCENENRFSMNGIYFHVVGDRLRSVATDGHRLACISVPLPEEARSMPGVIVSRRTVGEIRKLLEEDELPVRIGLSPNRIEIVVATEHGEARFSSRLIDSTYPAYEEVLADQGGNRLLVQTKELEEAVDRMATVLNASEPALRFQACDHHLTLKAVDNSTGSASEDVDVDYPPQEIFSFCLNPLFVLDVLKQIKTAEISLTLASVDLPILVEPMAPAFEGAGEKYVLMPLIEDTPV